MASRRENGVTGVPSCDRRLTQIVFTAGFAGIMTCVLLRSSLSTPPMGWYQLDSSHPASTAEAMNKTGKVTNPLISTFLVDNH